MRHGSLFTGIGGFDLGFERAGIESVWQVEIDEDCRSVLVRHFPDSRKHKDVRKVSSKLTKVDVISGGFPCQDLSLAGRQVGMTTSSRSGLFYQMTRIVDDLRPRYLIWENVPGLLSARKGEEFGKVFTELDRIGYYGAWKCLDARVFGLPQSRARVFGVFSRGRSAPERCARILDLQDPRPQPAKNGRTKEGPRPAVCAPGVHRVVGEVTPPYVFEARIFRVGRGRPSKIVHCLRGAKAGATADSRPLVVTEDGTIRHLTPVEWERIQGFPSGWTKGHSTWKRYSMVGNSVVPTIAEWIATRILEVG